MVHNEDKARGVNPHGSLAPRGEAPMSTQVADRRPTLAYDSDVLVVGGGAAGVAAAVTAARKGLRVLLLEKYGFCGGAAVAGLSGTICGMYAATDATERPPEQIVFGFADRFVKLLQEK